MAETFTSMFEVIRDTFAEDQEDKERDYLKAPERMREAEEAQPCVERFVDYEFDPPEGKGAGRGKAKWPVAEPIAKSLTNQLAKMDEADLEWMRDTVTGSIAFGYVVFCLGQSVHGEFPPPQPGGDPRQLWERWMTQLSSDILQRALRKQALKNALEIEHFEGTMKKHGVYQLKTAPAIKLLSKTYSRAGMTLRLLQCTDEHDAEPHKKTLKELPNWPFERA